MGHNRENFGALLKSIIGNLKSIIGSGLITVTLHAFSQLYYILPVTISLTAFEVTLPPLLLATQVYVLSSDDLISGITNVLLLIPVTLLGNDPDSIIH